MEKCWLKNLNLVQIIIGRGRLTFQQQRHSTSLNGFFNKGKVKLLALKIGHIGCTYLPTMLPCNCTFFDERL